MYPEFVVLKLVYIFELRCQVFSVVRSRDMLEKIMMRWSGAQLIPPSENLTIRPFIQRTVYMAIENMSAVQRSAS